MNGRVFKLDIPEHQAVQELLPWYASGQLAANDCRRVAQHLQACEHCRQDLEWERRLHVGMAADQAMPAGLDMEAALARLMPALGAQEPAETAQQPAQQSPMATHAAAADDACASETTAAPAVPTATTQAQAQAGKTVVAARWWRSGAANQPSWLRGAVAAQWLLIVGLIALLMRPDDPAPLYRVLGNGDSPVGNLVVMFQPSTTERDLRRILQAQGARVVDGPTVTDAYVLSVSADNRDRALQALRTDPAVKLAEPLDEAGKP